MGETARDPIDYHRTTQPLAGETMKNTAKTPGLVLVAVAVVAFVVCLASFAIRQVDAGIGAAIVALLAAGAALAWLAMEARRVRRPLLQGSQVAHRIPHVRLDDSGHESSQRPVEQTTLQIGGQMKTRPGMVIGHLHGNRDPNPATAAAG
jgi:hypothetical protein